jgi:VWFA-related protein
MIRAALIVLAAGMLATPSAVQQPTFTAKVEGVRVDVMVVDGSRKPFRGLAPDDFEIRDNGILQKVDVISFGEVPLSVTLAFDLSESVAGTRLGQLQNSLRGLADALEPRDESAFLTFDRAVSLRCPMSANVSCVRTALDSLVPTGQTALVDGAFSGMVVGESEVGRSLLMVFSDGMDTASYMSPALVLDAARQSDVVAYAVTTGGIKPKFIEDLAEITGGRVLEAKQDTDLSPTFRAVLDEFRYRYLVTYTPTGVTREGWHRLEVRVKRPGARVRARPGYQGR